MLLLNLTKYAGFACQFLNSFISHGDHCVGRGIFLFCFNYIYDVEIQPQSSFS